MRRRGVDATYEHLARLLGALASPTRLALLHQLRTPRLVSDIRAPPSLTRAGEREDRPLARQTVAHHVEQLAAAGLVHRVPMPDGRGEGYTLHHPALFALLDEVRRLGKLRSVVGDGGADTVEHAPPAIRLPPPPRVVVAYGREDGAAFPLPPTGGGPWRLGRAASCPLRLDHDPWVSGEHAEIARVPGGYVLTDLRSRNGTWVDWARAEPDRPVPLGPGALIMAGRTLLVFQPGP